MACGRRRVWVGGWERRTRRMTRNSVDSFPLESGRQIFSSSSLAALQRWSRRRRLTEQQRLNFFRCGDGRIAFLAFKRSCLVEVEEDEEKAEGEEDDEEQR